ncbi:uncharacterized protein LOC131245557 isoform X1 [Magnolia sinica]|uniref:uncharacterized protein LOC131245557 isoform X1 n=1 Tax=Magnolia sinica TaxID=86752 RepID=UPI0026586401|nr:uncharacterized protein LOC131245557 isoform X1 [Magnolia sinica]
MADELSLDLDELRQLQTIAKRPRIISLISSEIRNLEKMMFSTSAIPSKEWMLKPKLSEEYLIGVLAFLKYLRQNIQSLGGDDRYYCPCVKCCNVAGGRKKLDEISEHLICDGIDTSYTTWIFHGEQWGESQVIVGASTPVSNRNEDTFLGMANMVNDTLGHFVDKEDANVTCIDECHDGKDREGPVHDMDGGITKIALRHLAPLRSRLDALESQLYNVTQQTHAMMTKMNAMTQPSMGSSSQYKDRSSSRGKCESSNSKRRKDKDPTPATTPSPSPRMSKSTSSI